jgi:hypothetical protein
VAVCRLEEVFIFFRVCVCDILQQKQQEQQAPPFIFIFFSFCRFGYHFQCGYQSLFSLSLI